MTKIRFTADVLMNNNTGTIEKTGSGMFESQEGALYILDTDNDQSFMRTMLASRDTLMVEIDGVKIPLDRLCEIAEAEQEGRLIVTPCKVGDMVDTVFSHNESIALWEEHKDEEGRPAYLIWAGMAHELQERYREAECIRIFGLIPESVWYADRLNILVKVAALAEKGAEE